MTTIISTVMAIAVCLTSLFVGTTNTTNIPQDATHQIIVQEDNHAFVNENIQIECHKDIESDKNQEETQIKNKMPICLKKPQIDIILPPRLIKKPGIILPIPRPPMFPRYPILPRKAEVPNEQMLVFPAIESKFEQIAIN